MKPVLSAASREIEDHGERTALMGPLLIAEGSTHRADLNDLVVELATRSAGFRRSLPDGVLTGLATLVRAMNCYYSNLIEGHNTHRSTSNARSRATSAQSPNSATSNSRPRPTSRSRNGSTAAA